MIIPNIWNVKNSCSKPPTRNGNPTAEWNHSEVSVFASQLYGCDGDGAISFHVADHELRGTSHPTGCQTDLGIQPLNIWGWAKTYEYFRWLRNSASPKGWLRPVNNGIKHLSTVAGFRNHPTNYQILGEETSTKPLSNYFVPKVRVLTNNHES